MSEQHTEQDAATEAAQNVVDDVTSYEYSGDADRIGSQLDAGLAEAGVQLDDDQRDRIVESIDALKQDEDGGTPQVEQASPTRS